MSDFRIRRLESSDECELNSIYNRITGNVRTGRLRPLELMQWIWHKSPGGHVDSWIVEARDDSGWKIIGHHALCPVRFTFKDQDWLCAKTMHSFLLPDYRNQFLYLKFEQECLRASDSRFDATYSVGPGTSRLRTAFGYKNYSTWLRLERGLQPLHLVYGPLAYVIGRYSYPARVRIQRWLASVTAVPSQSRSPEFREFRSVDSGLYSFFQDFWEEARSYAGMAPRRDIADLEWRFWKRPGCEWVTLTHESVSGGRAFFIIDTCNPITYNLWDFWVDPVCLSHFERLLEALFGWCARQGALAIRCMLAPLGFPDQMLEVLLRNMRPMRLQRFLPTMELPRRLSPRGRARHEHELPNWNTTQFLMLD